MKRLFIARHGETVMNREGVLSGQIETPLTKEGKIQAKKSGREFKQKIPKIDLIISSDLSRAYHTALIIAQEIGYPEANIIKSNLFIERGYGDLEGTSREEFFKDHKFSDIDHVNGAEDVISMHNRALKAYRFIISRPENNILIVSHGAFGRALIRVTKEIPHIHEYDENHRKEYHFNNAEIIKVI